MPRIDLYEYNFKIDRTQPLDELAKNFRTRQSCYEVRFYAMDGKEPFPIHGAYKAPEGWMPCCWALNGKWTSRVGDFNYNLDLVFTPAEELITGYLLIQRDPAGTTMESGARIVTFYWDIPKGRQGFLGNLEAIVPIRVQFRKGDGL